MLLCQHLFPPCLHFCCLFGNKHEVRMAETEKRKNRLKTKNHVVRSVSGLVSSSRCILRLAAASAHLRVTSVDEERWRSQSAAPLSHCYECKAASPFPDLWLSAVKAVTSGHTAVQYKHFPFSPVPRRVYELAKRHSKSEGRVSAPTSGGRRGWKEKKKQREMRLTRLAWCGAGASVNRRDAEKHITPPQMDTRWPRRPIERWRHDSPHSREALPAEPWVGKKESLAKHF